MEYLCESLEINLLELLNWNGIGYWKSKKVILSFISHCLLLFQATFLLLITLSNDGTKTLSDGQRPVALLCIGCVLISSSVLLFLKSIWKACHKTSKIPDKKTLVLVFEFLVAMGAAILTIIAMPHLDIVTNITILSSVAVLSALLQAVTQCTARARNRFLVPSITAVLLILLGYGLFLYLYITKDLTDTKTMIWVGLAVGGSFLMSFTWWENYLGLISQNSSSVFLNELCSKTKKCQNMLNMVSSLLRIAVTAAVLGAYVPLVKMDWDVVTAIPSRETRIIAIIIGVQLISSALCHWFALAACKMHALRRCFILPLHLASLAVMVLFIVPVIVYYQDHKTSLNGTSIDFETFKYLGRLPSLVGICGICGETEAGQHFFSNPFILLPSGYAVCWWLGLVLATLHIWFLSLYRIQRTQDLFTRRLFEGGFLEQSLLLNTRFDIQRTEKRKQFKSLDPVKVFLCATMWHETQEEMMNIIISIFRLDRYRPNKKEEKTDVTFEGHIYFDDAFKNVPGSQERLVNEYLTYLSSSIVSIFLNINKGDFTKQQQIPDQKILTTPYGGRVEITMPHGNSLIVHFKDKTLIRHKKRWSQVMYLYYLLGWKLNCVCCPSTVILNVKPKLCPFPQKEKHNTYILALDGDTDFQPAAVMLLIDRLKLYPRVGAACGRIHPTGTGPIVWYQKFEYAVGHWLHKTAEHVFGCVLCSPGCFSLFRGAALMDDNVMKRYTMRSSKAIHHIQYDQGEDRWLCTLLLKQGWRVEYNAAADAYTNAPEEFKEFYNQRRRWGPSTMANIADLLGCTTMISKRNPSISKAYMFYQFLSLVAGILAPSTVILMIAGSLTVLLDIHPSVALVMALIPPIIFLAISFKLTANTQIKIAGGMSVVYAFLMIIVGISISGNVVKEGTLLTPSSLFILALASFYVVTAILHPQEIGLVCYGFIYLISIPSAYLLLSIYSMVNMNNVSWGTRETANKLLFFKCWITQLQSLSDDMRLKEERLDKVSYGQIPGAYSGEQKGTERNDRPTEGLEKQGAITFVYFILNAFWLIVTFTLQLLDSSVFIKVPKIDNNLELTGEFIYIDPVGFMFILSFVLLVVIQFIGMLFHRIYTLIHYVAFMDTEPVSKKQTQEEEEQQQEQKYQTFNEVYINTTDMVMPRQHYFYYYHSYECCYCCRSWCRFLYFFN
uniref:chitin synthase n=1 Tax=Cyclopterus lumpus TaxID=8103 RepID=A0A8C2X777_CYCLU